MEVAAPLPAIWTKDSSGIIYKFATIQLRVRHAYSASRVPENVLYETDTNYERNLKMKISKIYCCNQRNAYREYITVSHASPAQDLYWFLEKRRATRLQHPPPLRAGGCGRPAGPTRPWRAAQGASLSAAETGRSVRQEAASGGPAVHSGLTYSVLCGHSGRGCVRPSPRPP